MSEIAITILSVAVSTIGVSSVISSLILKKINKIDKKLDEQSEAKKQENIIIISGLKAIGHLSEATAVAQKRGHTNGETETAIKYYKDFTNELNAYLVRQNAERNYGR